ncbi:MULTISPECIES: outer membrane beta-barrel protein [unclassified Helicobacter]|uniref:outer membrane beta-barrel protein n=1 Tax=unclassified Helicobacter TaxID=2593540 RepID=UPI000CF1B210|nr:MULTISPECIES: outer membrane beta-barrel protein [unclassified Helicobacter]
MRVIRCLSLIGFVFLFDFLSAREEQQVQEKQEVVQESKVQDTRISSVDSKEEINKYKSGVYLQASMGSVIHHASFKGSYGDVPQTSYTTSELNTTIGFSIGYQFFLNTYNGLRFYSASFYRDFKSLKYQGNKPFYIASLGIGLDYLLDFTKSSNTFGFFTGFGYEWNYGKFLNDLKEHPYILDKNILKTHGFFVRIGFSKVFSWRHRLELEFSLPFYNFLNFSGSGIDKNNKPYDIQKARYNVVGNFILSYIYVFGKKSANR